MQWIDIEVVYATAERQWVIPLTVEQGTTVEQAIDASGIRRTAPDADCAGSLGVFGEVVSGSHVLEDGDRVEIYRPLQADPKEVRRELAKLGRTMGRRRGPAAKS